MNPTVGIVEWRDVARNSFFPFEKDCGIQALFLDATFIQFDGFIPKLKKVTINADNVTLEFELDTGTYTHIQNAGDCVEGATIVLRDIDDRRYHGQLVTGPGLLYAFNNLKGTVLEPNISFSALTVRSIPKTAGLYSIEGTIGDVAFEIDHSQYYSIAGNTVTWNTVALPTNLPEVLLSSKNIYVTTDKHYFLEFDMTSKTVKTLFTIPIPVSAMSTVTGKLVCTKGNQLYDMTSMPPVKVGTTLATYTALSGRGNTLYGFGSAIDSVDHSAGTATPVFSSGSSSFTAYDTDEFIYTVPGPFDSNQGKKVADIVYRGVAPNTSTLIGLMTIAGNMYQPKCIGLVKLPDDDNTVHGLLTDNELMTLVKVDLKLGTAEVVMTTSVTSLGKPVALTDGKNVRVVLRRVIPLKHINKQAPVLNAMHFIDQGIIAIEKTGPDELTVNLAPEVDLTVIRRSLKYEEEV